MIIKMGEKYSGSYTITKVHVNGTIATQLGPKMTKRINIRREIPYHDDTT